MPFNTRVPIPRHGVTIEQTGLDLGDKYDGSYSQQV